MSYRILVVEDEADICELIVFTLKSHGYDVVSADCAEEAIRITDHFSAIESGAKRTHSKTLARDSMALSSINLSGPRPRPQSCATRR